MNDFGEEVRKAERELKARAKKNPPPVQNKRPAKKRVATKTTGKKRQQSASTRTKKTPPEKPAKSAVELGREPDGTFRKGVPPPVGTGFKPGVSGNPGGRPKRTPVTDAMRDLLNSPHPAKKYKGKTYAEVLALKEVELAIESGDMRAAQEITDRVEGRVPQSMQHGGPGGGPIPIEFSSVEENERRIAVLLARGAAAAGDGDNDGDGSGD
jgi:hypothetical protein